MCHDIQCDYIQRSLVNEIRRLEDDIWRLEEREDAFSKRHEAELEVAEETIRALKDEASYLVKKLQ